ncbi:MAG: DRTGG domain-containing protein [Verrucomicrobiota bacterium]|jgi:predicted transcriptional regulator
MKLKSATKLPSLLTVVEARPLTDLAEVDLSGCYISDLLSDVLANAQPGVLWVTIHTHRNVVSVASMKDITAVLFTCGRKPQPAIIAEAAEKGIMLLSTPLTTYETAGKLWKAGLR